MNKRGTLPRAILRCFVVAGVALLLALGVISWQAFSTGNRSVVPGTGQKGRAIEAEQAQRKIDFALELGIPATGLRGTDSAVFRYDSERTRISPSSPWSRSHQGHARCSCTACDWHEA